MKHWFKALQCGGTKAWWNEVWCRMIGPLGLGLIKIVNRIKMEDHLEVGRERHLP